MFRCIKPALAGRGISLVANVNLAATSAKAALCVVAAAGAVLVNFFLLFEGGSWHKEYALPQAYNDLAIARGVANSNHSPKV